MGNVLNRFNVLIEICYEIRNRSALSPDNGGSLHHMLGITRAVLFELSEQPTDSVLVSVATTTMLFHNFVSVVSAHSN